MLGLAFAVLNVRFCIASDSYTVNISSRGQLSRPVYQLV